MSLLKGSKHRPLVDSLSSFSSRWRPCTSVLENHKSQIPLPMHISKVLYRLHTRQTMHDKFSNSLYLAFEKGIAKSLTEGASCSARTRQTSRARLLGKYATLFIGEKQRKSSSESSASLSLLKGYHVHKY